jgi:hypothetical protein
MELVIKINLDNDAFSDEPGQEVSRILSEYSKKIAVNDDIKSLFDRFNDFNGNSVGTAEIFLYPAGKIEEKPASDSEPEINIVIGIQSGFVSYVATDSEKSINCIIADYDARDTEDGPELSYEIVYKDKNKFREYAEEIEDEAGEY